MTANLNTRGKSHRFSPGTMAGDVLIAHELVHVGVQAEHGEDDVAPSGPPVEMLFDGEALVREPMDPDLSAVYAEALGQVGLKAEQFPFTEDLEGIGGELAEWAGEIDTLYAELEGQYDTDLTELETGSSAEVCLHEFGSDTGPQAS